MDVAEQLYPRGRTATAIAAGIESRIRDGTMKPGSRLPTIRCLAEDLSVSPATVAAAYRRLKQRGMVTAQGRRGTRVSPRPALRLRPRGRLPEWVRDRADGNPDPELLPSLAAALRRIDRSALYGDEVNLPELVSLARRELRRDAIPADHVTIVGGALDGIERALAARLRPGDRVAVEDPGFVPVFDLVAALGMVCEPVAVDPFGMVPDALQRALKQSVQAVILTPRAQNPTGAALDKGRAQALAAALAPHPDVLVIEDDHAGPVAGVEAHTTVSGREGAWAVVRSVSKWLGPDLRIAILTGDSDTVSWVEGRRMLGTGWVSHILQELVVGLWTAPETPAMLTTATSHYSKRRNALVEALRSVGITVEARSGWNVWVRVPDEGAVTAGMLERGWAVARGDNFRLASEPGIRITTARLDPAEAPSLAADLAAVLRARQVRTHAV
jgi:DNA-binding transcriptional MocR family regulator